MESEKTAKPGEVSAQFPRHLLGIESLTRAQIDALLLLAASYKEERRQIHKGARIPAERREMLRGRVVVTLFFEASTRTRSSFEAAAHALGANVIGLQKEGSSVSKGETLGDTAKNLEAVGADALIIRHPFSGAPHLIAREVSCSVINAGDGAHEHPTQALLDALSLRERLGDLTGKTIAIIGDIANSRVARSNIHCLTRLGAHVRVGGPSTLLPVGIEKLGCTVHRKLGATIEGVDAVMCLRIQQERIGDALLPSTRDYARRWGFTQAHLDSLPKHAVVMHPGPVNRGVEITSEVLDGPRCLVMDQVDSGVAVRMAALALCLGSKVAKASDASELFSDDAGDA